MIDERLRIPPAYAMPCEFCGADLDVRSPGVCQWTSGWVERRTKGGGNAIARPVRALRYAHRRCVDAEPGQVELW